MNKIYKKQLKESMIISIHTFDETITAIPSRIITKQERDIIISLINNLPCDEQK